ncbi:MAG: M24 family metallopeptidase, partial [Promethearchaeota archaeon]
MNLVKYGIVGTGGAWAFHSVGMTSNPRIKVTSVFDINPKAVKVTAKRLGAEAFTDYDLFLQSDIDAVLIMIPHFLHEEYVVKAARAGKHVLCEKPMATTLEGCDLMIEETKKAGVKFMIAENHRFLPAHEFIHDVIKQGKIGRVFLVRAFEGVNGIPGLMKKGLWKGDPIMAGGGALMDMGAHKFATLQWILEDEVDVVESWVSKQVTRLDEKAEDNALSLIRFKEGAIGEIIVSFTVDSLPNNNLEIYGTKGTIIENHGWENPVRIFSNSNQMGEFRSKWYEPKLEHGVFPNYYIISASREDDYFTNCILNDQTPDFTPEQAKSAIGGILMGYLSAERGHKVSRQDLSDVEKTKGTKFILQNLTKSIQENYKLRRGFMAEPVGYRKERAQKLMNKYDVDAIIATTPVNVFYTSGLPTLAVSQNPILFELNNQYPNISIIFRDGDGFLLNWDLFQSVEDFSWIIEHKGVLNPKDARRAVINKLKKSGLAEKKIGLESVAPYYLVEGLKSKFPDASFIDADPIFIEMRLVKTDEEIERMAKSTEIAEKAIMACINASREGITDYELLKIARQTIIGEDAEGWNHLTMNIADSDPEAPGTGVSMKSGDLSRFDFGAVWKGYVSDVSRQVVLGMPTDAQTTLMDRLI